MSNYPNDFLETLKLVTAKRPKIIIEHILKNGSITSQEIKELYGYNHPPRAVRDVREHGIPIETYSVIGNDGRKIAAYKFGNPNKINYTISKKSGRTILSKILKKALIDKYGAKCFIYLEKMDESSLQIDHRVPYEIAGEQTSEHLDSFMLLSPSANRAKSWTCEHCNNWIKKDKTFCLSCFWASPENYDHIAGKIEKVIFLIFTGNEIEDYNKLIQISSNNTTQSTIKKVLHNYLLKKTKKK